LALPGGVAALQDGLECPRRGQVPGVIRETSMRKQAKKLVLAKETVAKLESGDLMQVAGGTVLNTACDGCYSGANTCNCTGSRNTCGTRLC
jgi:hypothetical protein